MQLSKKDILKLFKELNQELAKQEIIGELYLMGGAVMCLVFESRASTRDVDCYFKPSQEIRKIAEKVARKSKLPIDWLNDGVKGFISDNADFESYLELSNLRVLTAQPEYLLAMKCLAMRIGEEFHDEDDVRYLLRYLNINSYQKAVEVVTKYYPKDQFPQKTFYALEELLS